jgi:membrane associated rhomboid family serine protease
MYAMTPWVRRLLIANVVVFIASASLPTLYYEFALVPALLLQRPWTGVTYMFLHAGLGHLFFNMIALFFFGPRLEMRLGARDFLWLYFLSGFGGAAFSFLFAPQYPVVGASGAVYGVLLAFAMFWPRERIYIWAILPVEAWLLATIMVGASLWSGISGSQSGVAHFAHLGGLAFGFAYLKVRDWRRGSARREFQKKLEVGASGGGASAPGVLQERSALRRWEGIPVDALHEINRDEVTLLLEKARALGVRALSVGERQFLDRMAATTGR